MKQIVGLGRRDPSDESEPFNMAFLAMRGCGHINGVSRLHGAVSRSLFSPLFPHWPTWEVPVTAITNGIHVPTWDSVPANELWKMAAPKNRWVEHLEESAKAIEQVPDEQLWDFRAESRQVLVDYVRRRLDRQVRERGVSPDVARRAKHVLDPNVLTLGFARRFTEYKRPTLLLHDPERLRALLRHPERPMQLIVAGKSHPNDTYGKKLVQTMASFAASEGLGDCVVFLQDYDMAVAEQLVAGVDVWINTPRRPAEACGTSGMKLIVNGGLHLSVLDGWWDEAYAPDLGWALGGGAEHGGAGDDDDAEELYDLLENQVGPEFYDRDANGIPRRWIRRVRTSMTRLTVPFSSERMVRDYVEQVYVPAAARYAHRTRDNARVAFELEAWHDRIGDGWGRLHFGDLRVAPTDDGWNFEIQVYLGDVRADDVAVQLFAEPAADGEPPAVVPMRMTRKVPGAINGFLCHAHVVTTRPAEHFTPRVVPHHPDALVPLESSRMRWHQGAARRVTTSEVVA